MSKTIIDAINALSEELELGFCDDWAPRERLLMYELVRKWNSCGRPHRFSETNTELIKNTSFHKDTIIRARKELVARGYIEYIPSGNPRRAGQYSLEPFFRHKSEKAGGSVEEEQSIYSPKQSIYSPIAVDSIEHYQSNNSRASSSGTRVPHTTEQPPSAPAPLGRGSRPAKSGNEPRRVTNAEGRVFQIWPRGETGRKVIEEKKDGTLDEWKFRPSDSDDFITDILSMSTGEVSNDETC